MWGILAMHGKTYKISVLSLLVAQAIILGYVEALLAIPIPLPGIKIGLANIASILSLTMFGFREAVFISIIKSLIISFTFTGLTSFFFSITGGLLSILVMYILYKLFKDFLSIWSISIVGAIFHNIGQLAVASFIVGDLTVYSYLPMLLVSAGVTGALTGIISQAIIKSVKLHRPGLFDK